MPASEKEPEEIIEGLHDASITTVIHVGKKDTERLYRNFLDELTFSTAAKAIY